MVSLPNSPPNPNKLHQRTEATLGCPHRRLWCCTYLQQCINPGLSTYVIPLFLLVPPPHIDEYNLTFIYGIRIPTFSQLSYRSAKKQGR